MWVPKVLNPILSHRDEINLNKPSVWIAGKYTYRWNYSPSLVSIRPRRLSLPTQSSNLLHLSSTTDFCKGLKNQKCLFSPRKTGLNEGGKFLFLKQIVFFTTINLAITDLNYYRNRLVPSKSFYHLTLYVRINPVFRKCCQSLAFSR